MAISDILQAIITEADQQIADAQAAHKLAMKDLKESHEELYFAAIKQIDRQKDEKKHQMRTRVEGHAQMVARLAVLSKKQEQIDAVYAAAATALAALPKGELDHLFKACLKHIHGAGEIRPAKKHEAVLKELIAGHKGLTMGEPVDAVGGFRFVGETQEHDYTFEFLVEQVLRPATELAVARELFPKNA